MEKPAITVGLLPAPAAAPEYLADQAGDFKSHGLTVTRKVTTGGSTAIPRLAAGDYDFTLTNDATAISAYSHGIPLVFVADAYDAGPGTYEVETLNPNIKSVSDLVGKTVAVNTLADIGTLGLRAILRANSVDATKVKFVVVQFAAMEEALKEGAVDAIATQQPYLTEIEQHLGSRTVTDIFGAHQPMADMPIAAVVTTAAFVHGHPATVCAFEAAWNAGAQLAGDRAKIEQILPTYTGVSVQIAHLLQLGIFPTGLNMKRLQRVADGMWTFGQLDKQLSVAPMMPAACP